MRRAGMIWVSHQLILDRNGKCASGLTDNYTTNRMNVQLFERSRKSGHPAHSPQHPEGGPILASAVALSLATTRNALAKTKTKTKATVRICF